MSTPALNASIIGVLIALILAAAVFASFLLGMRYNLSRGNAALSWLRAGLPLLTERVSLARPGSSRVLLIAPSPLPPFKQLEVRVELEPRDFLLGWLAAHVSGQRDTLLVRAILRRPSRFEFELADMSTRAGKQAMRRIPEAWERTDLDGMHIASANRGALAAARQMLPVVQRMGGQVTRLSARRSEPNLEIHVVAPWQSGATSTEAMTAVKEIAEKLAGA